MARKTSDSPHTTGELRAAIGLDLSHSQRTGPGVTRQDEFQKLSEVRTQTHTRLHTHTHKGKGKEGRGRGGEGGSNKLNPVKLFFHSQWVDKLWRRQTRRTVPSDVRECLEFNPLSHVRLTPRPLPLPLPLPRSPAHTRHTNSHVSLTIRRWIHREANFKHLSCSALPALTQLWSIAALSLVWYSASILEGPAVHFLPSYCKAGLALRSRCRHCRGELQFQPNFQAALMLAAS